MNIDKAIKLTKVIAIVAAVLAVLLLVHITVSAFEAPSTNPLEVPTVMRVTCYTDTGTTATGCKTREGIVAGSPEWFGYVAALYEVREDGGIGDFIGYYEVLDTGAGYDTDNDGKGDSIKKGLSLDVWQSCKEDVEWWQAQHGDYLYVLIIPGKG